MLFYFTKKKMLSLAMVYKVLKIFPCFLSSLISWVLAKYLSIRSTLLDVTHAIPTPWNPSPSDFTHLAPSVLRENVPSSKRPSLTTTNSANHQSPSCQPLHFLRCTFQHWALFVCLFIIFLSY